MEGEVPGERRKSKFERVVTSEATLFTYRLLTSGAAVLLSVWMHSLITSNDDLHDKMADLNYKISVQMTSLSGKIDLNTSRIDAQARRLDGFQSDLRDTNNRINNYFFPSYGTPK